MARCLLCFLFVLAMACASSQEATQRGSAKPREIAAARSLRALECDGLIAEWHGVAPEGDAPVEYGVEELQFRFADGAVRRFRPAGTLFFSDHSFEIFSPDCGHVALLQDHYGPYHLVPVPRLADYLEGRHQALAVTATGDEASVLASGRWRSPSTFEFFAMCCGGAQVFRVDVRGGPVQRVFFAPEAPRGIERDGDHFRVP